MATAAQRAGRRRGRVAAGLDTALSIGEAAGPVVAGLIWDARGYVTFFAVRGVLGVATEVVLGRRLRRLLRQEAPEPLAHDVEVIQRPDRGAEP